MKNLKTFEQFINESNNAIIKNQQQYNKRLTYYKDLVKSLGVSPVDDIYECHEWVGAVMDSDKVNNVKYFLFDENKESTYYDEVDDLDKEFKDIFKKLKIWPYFDNILGHSFIKEDDIFIDLTLDSEGLTFNDIQTICKRMSKINIYYKK